MRAIADAVEEALRGGEGSPAHVEGYDRGEWILLDYFDFIVHVFAPETRAFYGLERLWGDAERIEVTDEPTRSTRTCDAAAAGRRRAPPADRCLRPTRGRSAAAAGSILRSRRRLRRLRRSARASTRASSLRARCRSAIVRSDAARLSAPAAADLDSRPAIGPYDGALRAIIHALKYDGRRSLARPLAALMRERGAEVLAGADCVVPVPLHPRAAASAASIRPRISRATSACRSIDALRAHARDGVAGRPAGRAPPRERPRRLRRCAAPRRGLDGLVVVLVDDVSTTGATLERARGR